MRRAAASWDSRPASSATTTLCAASTWNTPEGELFKKGNVLYGLHLARPAIAKQDRAIVVEGNTDVIALKQGEETSSRWRRRWARR